MHQVYILTGGENFTFKTAAKIMSDVLDRNISYVSPNLIRFFIRKRKEGIRSGFTIVMIMLHYLARFEKEPEISPDLQLLTEKEPTRLKEFLNKNKSEWQREDSL
ncbi:MAG: hypothetical protein ACNS60_09175 [Candidatus Cyclobacteriaceae bacterium M2_1C_046]